MKSEKCEACGTTNNQNLCPCGCSWCDKCLLAEHKTNYDPREEDAKWQS